MAVQQARLVFNAFSVDQNKEWATECGKNLLASIVCWHIPLLHADTAANAARVPAKKNTLVQRLNVTENTKMLSCVELGKHLDIEKRSEVGKILFLKGLNDKLPDRIYINAQTGRQTVHMYTRYTAFERYLALLCGGVNTSLLFVGQVPKFGMGEGEASLFSALDGVDDNNVPYVLDNSSEQPRTAAAALV
ncbi:hypothetical protein [Agaribacterium haliotis]|uniref:hypothetical protein n=1 Tax=Agaribacterium haliotis TaxID=2013869 RepID=UPI000BB53647|nr:hypothetical protein [Agaribacterium haliotis]